MLHVLNIRLTLYNCFQFHQGLSIIEGEKMKVVNVNFQFHQGLSDVEIDLAPVGLGLSIPSRIIIASSISLIG